MYDEKEDILLPDPEAYAEMKRQREQQAKEQREDMKYWSLFEVQQALRRANNNGYFSYRDLSDILKDIYDEDERAALKTLL